MGLNNRHRVMADKFKPVDDVVWATAQTIVTFCKDNNLSMEEITICFSNAIATLSCYEAETRLRKAIELRKDEKTNTLKDK